MAGGEAGCGGGRFTPAPPPPGPSGHHPTQLPPHPGGAAITKTVAKTVAAPTPVAEGGRIPLQGYVCGLGVQGEACASRSQFTRRPRWGWNPARELPTLPGHDDPTARKLNCGAPPLYHRVGAREAENHGNAGTRREVPNTSTATRCLNSRPTQGLQQRTPPLPDAHRRAGGVTPGGRGGGIPSPGQPVQREGWGALKLKAPPPSFRTGAVCPRTIPD